MMKQHAARLAALAASAALFAASVPVSADSPQMTFRTAVDTIYYTASELAESDAVTKAGMYIDNYTGISNMKVRLKCDAPLVIENADFTRDPSRTESDGGEIVAKPCFFEAHGTTSFVRNSDETGEPLNIALWYGPGSLLPEEGVIETPDSSFLSCEIRIPKGTPAGVYRFYVSDEEEKMSSGIINPDLIVRDGELNEVIVNLQSSEIVVEPAVLRGDVDCDGAVTVLDSLAALRYYGDFTTAKNERTDENLRYALKTPYIHTGEQAANVDDSERVDLTDVMAILRYAADARIGNNPKWEDCIR